MHVSAVLAIAACACASAAYETRSHNLRDTFLPFLTCTKNLGFSKCISAYGVWRANRAFNYENPGFSWKDYSNVTDEELYSKLCYGTQKLLEQRTLEMNLSPAYSLQLGATTEGTLNVDIIKNNTTDTETGRSKMKKMKKYFYNLIPLLLIPGLIMSAILPFFLPALKMMVLAVTMLNNMALTGAVFTLMRNNAFNDGGGKKVIYINAGYDNEKFEPLSHSPSHLTSDLDFYNKFGGAETHDIRDYHLLGDSIDTSGGYPLHEGWLKEFDSRPEGLVKVVGHRIKNRQTNNIDAPNEHLRNAQNS